MITVGEGADIADDWIAERIGAADVCVTADIPLAARCLQKGARALSSNGRIWTEDNIGGALAGREVVAPPARDRGRHRRPAHPLTKATRSQFLGALDTVLQAALRARRPPAGGNATLP